MEKVDLTKDREALEYYQADSLIDELLALEDHFSKIYQGNLVAFCISCLSKHFRLARKLSSECQEGRCQPEKLWNDINEWANEFLVTKPYKDLKPKDERALKWAQETRDFRKQLEEIVAKYEMFGNKDNDEKPLEP